MSELFRLISYVAVWLIDCAPRYMGSVKVPITPESGRERLGSERPEDFLATDQERERCKKDTEEVLVWTMG
jgi:hypothetical protein